MYSRETRGPGHDADSEKETSVEEVVPQRHPGRNTAVRPIVYRRANGAPIGRNARAALEQAASNAGQPLAPELRRKLERALAVDLSAVRVHTGRASEAAAAAVGANAYTVGQDIHFAAGQFQPGTAAGYRLIAHEVAHTLQQGSASATSELVVSSPGDSAEREADHIADEVGARADADRDRANATVSTALAPRPGHRDVDASRLGVGHGLARQAEAPSALPLTIGHTISGVLSRDPAPAGDSSSGSGSGDPAQGEVVGPKSGTIEDKQPNAEQMGGGCDLHGPGCPGGHGWKFHAAVSVTPTFTQQPQQGAAMGYDSIANGGIIRFGHVGQGGVSIPGTAFGYAEPKFGTKSFKWDVRDKNTVYVSGEVTVDCSWDVQALGRTDVGSADDAVLTPQNFMQAYYDLRHEGDRPERKQFWSKSFTQQHEQFHCAEYYTNAQAATTSAVSWLTSQPISVPTSVLGVEIGKSVQSQIDPLVAQLPEKVKAEVKSKFDSGGEDRAYGAGAQAYRTLANAIRDRGFSKGWEKQQNKPAP